MNARWSQLAIVLIPTIAWLDHGTPCWGTTSSGHTAGTSLAGLTELDEWLDIFLRTALGDGVAWSHYASDLNQNTFFFRRTFGSVAVCKVHVEIPRFAGTPNLAIQNAVNQWSIFYWALFLGTWIMTIVSLLIGSTCQIRRWWCWKSWSNWCGRVRNYIALILRDTCLIGSSEESFIALATNNTLKSAKRLQK
ncbi:hypothetical protein GCK72_022052 [Caenorhabditis remanei]|uniref:Uncharacterized protein n=1 Tax=Caenorhabditis remanei TaxID=31234 RepID=A0A6A5GLD1_CAERE|nr:hypothetical protein GCK72_022052 [Caenorhabditis remanei]KAF1755483.1 hypothetical protein GCK72_022052 [Caenorhabditis remanei]